MKQIVCFHLLNDYSGSPQVLHNVICGLLEKGYSVDLITSYGGILDGIPETKMFHRRYIKYSFSKNRLITLIRFIIAQLNLFFLAIGYRNKKNSVFYINTILPFGAAIAGKLIHKEVIYHYHENAKTKSFFYRLLAFIMQKKADKIVCVSDYQRFSLKRKNQVYVVPNALDRDIEIKLMPNEKDYVNRAFELKNVLMLASLKKYKGVFEFLKLASLLEDLSFTLVINDTEDNIESFFGETKEYKRNNIRIYPRQANVVPFYKAGSVVLNLSDSSKFIETFGLTTLEAFTAGLPVIVPEIGGIAELVDDGVNGYKIPVQKLDEIANRLKVILHDKKLYTILCKNALCKSKEYSSDKMINTIISIIQ